MRVLSMAWWKGSYVAALLDRGASTAGAARYAICLFSSVNLDASSVLCSIDLPDKCVPSRICVGSTAGPHTKVSNWLVVAAESASSSLVNTTSPTNSVDSRDSSSASPVVSSAGIDITQTHSALWAADGKVSPSTPVLLVYRLRLVAKDTHTPAAAPAPAGPMSPGTASARHVRHVNSNTAASLILQTSVLLPAAARQPLALSMLQHTLRTEAAEKEPPPDILLLTRDANLVCISLGSGTQSLVAPSVSMFWLVSDGVFGGQSGFDVVYILINRHIQVRFFAQQNLLCVHVLEGLGRSRRSYSRAAAPALFAHALTLLWKTLV